MIATWEQDGSGFVLSHDVPGEGLSFSESIGPEDIELSGTMQSNLYSGKTTPGRKHSLFV